MNNLLIGTTAINRKDLHSDNIYQWIELFCNTTNSNVKWFLNIDIVELLEFTYEETLELFKEIENKFDNLELFVLPKKKAGFLEACQVVSQSIIEYKENNQLNNDNTYVIWLEDDWKLNPCSFNLDFFINPKIITNNTSVHLTFIKRNYFWALAPSLIGYELFYNLHYSGWKELKDNNIQGDPEHLLGRFFIKNFGFQEKFKSINIIRKNINENYMDQEFLNYERVMNNINDNLFNFEIKNRIFKDNIKEYIDDDVVYIRNTPGWTINGVMYGRNYMKKKEIEKWKRGDSDNINYNKK